MRVISAIIGTLGLLPIAAFCLFGFAATFEPTNTPGVFMAFRIGYAVIGLGCLAGIVFLIARCFKNQQDALP
jgi:uncharacterized membrane protein YuzA (DUF378 family)